MHPDDDVDFYHPGKNQPEKDIPDDETDSDAEERPSKKRTARAMSWNAPEYMEFERNAGWYAGLALATLVLAAGIYLLSKDYFAIGSVLAVGIIFGFFVSRKPQNIDYELSDSGLEVGKRSYTYGQFKSFTIVREGQLSSVELLPLKRWMLPVSACFVPEDENKIMEIIGEHLPYVEHKPGLVDKMSQRLRL